MSCWEFLGIAPTQDQRAIKRAYAKLLKVHKPDQDPEGFKQLREAYDCARYLAEQMEYEAEQEDVNEGNPDTNIPNAKEAVSANEHMESVQNIEVVASATMPVEQQSDTEIASDEQLEASLHESTEQAEKSHLEAAENEAGVQEAEAFHEDEHAMDDICAKLLDEIGSRLSEQKEVLELSELKAIHELDLQSKRDVSFRVFHYLAELVMSPDPSTPKPTDKHFVSIAAQLEAEFHWNVDPLIEQYFSSEQINRVLPKYFELRLAEVDKQKLFQPVEEKAPPVLPHQPVGMWRSIARWFVDFFIVFVSLELINIGLAKVFAIDLFAILESTPTAFPALIVIVLSMFFYGVVSNALGGKGTIGARVFGLVVSRIDGSKPELYQILLHYATLLPWLVFTITGKYVFISLSLSLLMEHWLGLQHIYRKDAHWLEK